MPNSRFFRPQFDEALELLRRYSLIRRQAMTNTISVHRLVQAVIKDGMNTKTQRHWLERVVRALNRAFPEVESETREHCERYWPHVQAYVEALDQHQLVFAEAAQLFHQVGSYLQARARYEAAVSCPGIDWLKANHLGSGRPGCFCCSNVIQYLSISLIRRLARTLH